MEIVNPKAQTYAELYSSPPTGCLEQIAAETFSLRNDAHMLSGHLQGKFLEILSSILQPRNILEIGTYVGYSALCLSKGLRPGGKLYTIEQNPQNAEISRENFSRANASGKIILHLGNALNIIPELKEKWDLVFIDADKTNYINYYRLVLPRVRRGGLIIADNVLFHGEVLEPKIKGKHARFIQAFNELIKLDESVQKVMLTVRDGLFLLRKI